MNSKRLAPEMIELEFTLADCDRIDAAFADIDPYWTKTELAEYEAWLYQREEEYHAMDMVDPDLT